MKLRASAGAAFALLLWAQSSSARAAAVAGRVIGADGRPVGGAAVSCRPLPPAERRLLDETRGVEPKPIAAAKTNQNGVFSIRFVKDPGDLLLRVTAEGLVSRELEVSPDSDQPGGELEIVLPDGRRFEGRVTEESGRPLAGVRVRVFGFDSSDEGDLFAEATTAADGRFEVANAPEGDVAVEARVPGLVRGLVAPGRTSTSGMLVLKRGGTVEGTLLDPAGKPAPGLVVCGEAAGETDGAGRYRVDGIAPGLTSVRARRKDGLAARRDGVAVRKGETTRVDLELKPAAVVSGAVVDEKTHRALSGVRVSVAAQFGKSSLAEGTARTDARGRFQIGGLSSGEYEVRTSRRGYLPGRAVAAAGAQPAPLALGLRKAGGIAGHVVDEQGTPVAGARVGVWPPFGRRAMFTGSPFGTASAPSYRDGSFRLRDLPVVDSSVVAEKPGWVAARRNGVAVRSGEVTKGIVLILRRGAEATGRVVDRVGQPVAGAGVRLYRPDSSDTPSTVADSAGRFSVRGVAEGSYAARVSARGFATRVVDALRVGKNRAEWAPFVLAPSASMSGSVRNARGEPVAGASIRSEEGADEENRADATSDAEGRFQLDGWADGDSVELTVEAEGYSRLTRTVAAPAEGLTFILPAAGTLRGRVEDAKTQKPLETFSLEWLQARGSQRAFGAPREEFRAPDGVFDLPGVGPGRIVLRGSAPGYVETELGGLDLKEGEIRDGIVVSLKRGLDVTGRVREPSHGDGVANAGVQWQREGTSFPFLSGGGDTATDADGRFHFEGLPPAPLRFVARHPDFVETSRVVDPSAETEVELTLSIGGAIVGSVVTREGAPVDDAMVSLTALGGPRVSWSGDARRADPQGLFGFEHLSEGRYKLTAIGGAGQSASQEVVVERDQRVEGIRLALQGGARVRGRVRGLPAERLGGLAVWAGAEDFSAQATTSDEGEFEIENAPPGRLSLIVTSSARGIGRSVRKTIDVPPDVDEIPVEVVFEGDSRLSGRVLRGGRGVSGVSVSARADPPASGSVDGADVTDADGVYAIEGLADGDDRVTATGEGVSASRRVTVSGDTTLDIVVGGTALSGVIRDEKTGEPIEGTIVQAETGEERGPYGIPSARSDARGFYEIDDLEPAAYQVTARHEGYASKTQSVSVDDSPAEVDFSLSPGSGVSLHAVDGLVGLPLRGVDVLAFSGSGATAFYGTVPLDEDGRGEVPELGAGRYTLYVYARGYAPRILSASVPSAPLEVALTPGGRVEVRSETPVTGQIFDAAGLLYLSSPGRTDGIVNVDAPLTIWRNFTPGSYRLVIPGASGEESYEFAVSEGKTTAVELR